VLRFVYNTVVHVISSQNSEQSQSSHYWGLDITVGDTICTRTEGMSEQMQKLN